MMMMLPVMALWPVECLSLSEIGLYKGQILKTYQFKTHRNGDSHSRVVTEAVTTSPTGPRTFTLVPTPELCQLAGMQLKETHLLCHRVVLLKCNCHYIRGVYTMRVRCVHTPAHRLR